MLLLEIIITILFYLFLPFYFVERVIHKKSHANNKTPIARFLIPATGVFFIAAVIP